MAEYIRQDMVWEKEDLLINGTGKYHDYNFYRVAGKQIKGKDKGEALNEAPPVDVRSLLPRLLFFTSRPLLLLSPRLR